MWANEKEKTAALHVFAIKEIECNCFLYEKENITNNNNNNNLKKFTNEQWTMDNGTVVSTIVGDVFGSYCNTYTEYTD